MFLRNGWYSAIWSHELKDKPVGRTFLNEKVVLFRNASGQVGALEDRCCHRAAPLSHGELAGEYLACGYHGLKFDVNGQCVEVPGQSEVPAGAKVRSYPVQEKRNVVWIWMGDPANADPAKIPDMPWLSDAEMGDDARHHPREGQLPVHSRQSARSHPRRLRAQEHARRRSARGHDARPRPSG